VHIGERGSTGVAVVDPLHYIVIDSQTGRLQATSDGGNTWQPAASRGLSAALRLRYWDPTNGAAVVQMTNGQAPAAGLLRTADGGQEWDPVVIAGPTSPTPSPDVTARYPDGIPSTLLGQHVYRPGDLAKTVPTGPFLLGGWDAGPMAVSCPAMIPGASNPPCPAFEGLAETRGGPMVIAVRWGAFPVPGVPALVLRVTAEPAPTCVSIPPGGCPGPSVTVQDVLWAGDPSASTSPSPSPGTPSNGSGGKWGPLAVVPPQDGADTARSEGTLRITDTCVFLDQPGGPSLLVWPADRTTWNGQTRTITFANFDGTTVSARDGTPVVLGGSGDSNDASGTTTEAWLARTPWVAPPAASCPAESRWWVGALIR